MVKKLYRLFTVSLRAVIPNGAHGVTRPTDEQRSETAPRRSPMMVSSHLN